MCTCTDTVLAPLNIVVLFSSEHITLLTWWGGYILSRGMRHCIRLSSRRRSVNLLPVAQRSNALTNGVIDRPWVVGREFESHVHHENSFQRKINFLMSRTEKYFWIPRDLNHVLVTRWPVYLVCSRGDSVVRLSLGRRSVNLLPVAQRTSALTSCMESN